MNRRQADFSLLAITLMAGIQYVFLKNVSNSVSGFAFLFITNLIGFIICLSVLGGELYRATKIQILYSLILAGLLLGFNLFMLMGASGLDTTVTSFVVTAYIVFVPLVSLLFGNKIKRCQIVGITIVLFGLVLSMGVNLTGFANSHILYLVVADVFFSISIVLLEKISARMNPAVLVLGELFFGSIFALAGWALQDDFHLSLPSDPGFWSSALFVAFFIRGMYGIIQIYAQRYVSAIRVSLIFSTEIIFTLMLSPVLSFLMGTAAEKVTVSKIIGCGIIVLGVLTADDTVWKFITRRKQEADHE